MERIARGALSFVARESVEIGSAVETCDVGGRHTPMRGSTHLGAPPRTYMLRGSAVIRSGVWRDRVEGLE
jgi:hypothetical protein